MERRLIVQNRSSPPAILLCYLGLWMLRVRSRFGTRGRLTVGQVVDVEMKSDNLGLKFSPKMEFETLEGQKIIFFGESTEHNHRLKGRSVKIIYLPESPADAEIRSDGPSVVIIIVFLFATLSLFASAMFYLGFAR